MNAQMVNLKQLQENLNVLNVTGDVLYVVEPQKTVMNVLLHSEPQFQNAHAKMDIPIMVPPM